MALIVESGTGIAGAESYISVVDAHARAALLGWICRPTKQRSRSHCAKVLVLRAISQQIPRRQTDNHSRPSVSSHGRLLFYGAKQDPAHIPQLLVDAQVRSASVAYSGGNLFATGLIASSKSVGDVSLSYSGGKADNSAWMGDVMIFLKPLFKDAALGAAEFVVGRA